MNQLANVETWGIAFVLILTRVAAFLVMLPVFGDRNLPQVVKIGFAVSLSFLWFGSQAMTTAHSFAATEGRWFILPLFVVREAVFGGLLGYWFGLLLLPARIAGSYIGQEMGLTMSTVTDPGSQTSSNVVSLLFESFALTIFFLADIHHVVLGVLHASFEKWPVGGANPSIPIGPLSSRVAEAHHWGLELAAPVAICLFLNLMVLALLMKAVPQLNLFSIGLTVRLLVGFVATLAFLPEVLSMMSNIVHRATGFVPL